MEVSETVFWFVLIPALIVLVIGGLVYASVGDRRDRRYRPGRPYSAAPVWFLSAQEGVDQAAEKQAAEKQAAEKAALPGQPQPTRTAPERWAVGVARPQGATGGASDRW